MGGPDSYEASRPQELFEIVQSVNACLEIKGFQLSICAVFLSSVSHNLGSPTKRLRLLAALIKVLEICQKLKADIDKWPELSNVLKLLRAPN